MHDQHAPDFTELYRLAEEQGGFLSASQARERGFSRALLSYHARPGGRLERVAHGLYRLALFPTTPFDHVYSAWVAAGPAIAVVSHESALELYELADVIPDQVHLTIPREQRWRKPPRGVRLHTMTGNFDEDEVRRWRGLRITSPERSLLDSAESGVQPEQVQRAVADALRRGLVTSASLLTSARGRPAKTQGSIERAVSAAS